jgi:uncharacterized membrane protein YgdD (TMEM256/DUF423 family)
MIAGFGPLSLGAIFGALGVVFGAFGSHYLEGRLDPEQLDAFQTAVRYQMYHAVLLVAMGFSSLNTPRLMTVMFAGGIVLFSGSIYGLVFLDWWGFGPLTPIGGTLLIIGWVWLAIWSFSVL